MLIRSRDMAVSSPVPTAVTPRIQSVARAIAVLEAIARSPAGTTAREISAEVGLSRATTYHFLQSLSAVGYVSAGSGHRYRVALGVSPLVQAFERHVLPEDLLPLARVLASRTGESTYVAARLGAELNLLTSVPGHHQVAVATNPLGPIADGHARASGKLLLALAPEDARERYLALHPLRRMTRMTITSPAVLLDAFVRIRADGYAYDEEEYADGVCCLAAPLGRGGVAYALVLSAPRERYEAHRDEYKQALLEIANPS
jgi:IclR family acetate operon transcriptional repressor